MSMEIRSPSSHGTPVHFHRNTGRVRGSGRFRSHGLLGGSIALIDLEGVDGPEGVCKCRRIILNIVDASWGKVGAGGGTPDVTGPMSTESCVEDL